MLNQAYAFLSELLSKGGFSGDGFSVKGDSPFSISISLLNDEIHVDLPTPLKGKFTKKILGFSTSMNLDVEGLILRKNSGIIKLKNFVDFPFEFE